MKDSKENTGDWNTGDWNTGDRNTGDRNTGYRNTGYRNTGYRNTGSRNTGNQNTGGRNTGSQNTGGRNTGNRNTGDWNTGDRNTGYLNTDQPKVRIFNKDSNLSFEEIEFPSFFYFETSFWICASEMTDKEKEENPFYETTKGFLKTIGYKEAFKKSWDEAGEDDRAKLFDLPNFDADIFYEISGINVDEK